jgi:hypothetical protein
VIVRLGDAGSRRDRRAVAGLFMRSLLTRPARASTPAPGEPVAQMVEHLTFNQVVDGSIPSGLTNIIRYLIYGLAPIASQKLALGSVWEAILEEAPVRHP